jgi:hypothetical protein
MDVAEILDELVPRPFAEAAQGSLVGHRTLLAGEKGEGGRL